MRTPTVGGGRSHFRGYTQSSWRTVCSPFAAEAARRLRTGEQFEELEESFNESKIKIPGNLKQRVRAVLNKHGDLRWDDATQIVLDKTQLDRVRAEKQKAKKKSGDFTDADEDEEDDV
jgi:hypothetical protein